MKEANPCAWCVLARTFLSASQSRKLGHAVAGIAEEIYRLKLKVSVPGLSNAAIPGFFVLKVGAFVEFVSSNVSPVE